MDPMEVAIKYLVKAEELKNPRLADKAKVIHDRYADFPDPEFNRRCRAAGSRIVTALDRLFEAGNRTDTDEDEASLWEEITLDLIHQTDRL